MNPLITIKLVVESLSGPFYLAGTGAFVNELAIMLVAAKSVGPQSYWSGHALDVLRVWRSINV